MLKAQRYRNRSTQCVDAPTATVISSVQKTQYQGNLQLTTIIQCVHTTNLNKYVDICIHVYLDAFIKIYWTTVNVTKLLPNGL